MMLAISSSTGPPHRIILCTEDRYIVTQTSQYNPVKPILVRRPNTSKKYSAIVHAGKAD
jgi:hypothetical protein